MSKEETGFINYYVCPECRYYWVETWSCACDSECHKCGLRNISPLKYMDLMAPDWCNECTEKWIKTGTDSLCLGAIFPFGTCRNCGKELENDMNDIHEETAAKIFESPDGGKTVYERNFGEEERTIVKTEDDEKWEAIQKHCRELSKEMIRWQEEEFARWDKHDITEDECNTNYTDIDIGEDFQL